MQNELVIRIRNEGQHFCVQIVGDGSGGYSLYDHKFKSVRIEGFGEQHYNAYDCERRQKLRSRRKRQTTRKGTPQKKRVE